MARGEHRAGLVPALLKQWRAQRGLSQLDLALAADVSARHVSFIETGRSLPSADMVLRLASTLGVPLRQVNTMLVAAGHSPVYDDAAAEMPETIRQAIDLLMAHHEPFPVVVIDRSYDVVDLNRSAIAVLGAVLGLAPTDVPADADGIGSLGLNLMRLTFDPHGAQPWLVNFDEVGSQLLWRLQRESLAQPDDGELRALIDDILEMPTVAPDWRDVDLSTPAEPALVLHLQRGDIDLRFLTTVTSFQAPQNVDVEQLQIEHWFPTDELTAETCTALARSR
ncbi:helix-turn-helix transcriptional regulator [Dermatobacter hominis]|uniref:helix-turn-helix transcriptional regulator n=1 Tax=Dermatobacter hominis TaxID=2884263 RepID=UPI001D0F7D99|nr:helix-turn-helix transcriptional regulator [Dermatobacter hominis]UDY35834.1 helix-turn-helix transcriptional regulator [Dermatobacter hominis]